jgi:excisionase family DNA binding protein
MEDFVLLPDAARELNLSRAVLWRHVKAGRLPAQRLGRLYVIRRADLATFQKNRRKPGRPPKDTPA